MNNSKYSNFIRERVLNGESLEMIKDAWIKKNPKKGSTDIYLMMNVVNMRAMGLISSDSKVVTLISNYVRVLQKRKLQRLIAKV